MAATLSILPVSGLPSPKQSFGLAQAGRSRALLPPEHVKVAEDSALAAE
ncbi:MAG: hypothetical protein ABSD21_01390 [Rhizomicrobium sp.]